MTESNFGAQAQAQIETLLNEWKQAAASKHAPNMKRFYTDDVIVFDVVPPLSYQGADLHISNWQQWFDKLNEPISFDILNSAILVSGNLASVLCMTQMTIGDKVDIVRTSLFLTNIGDEWLIAHVHSSVPLPVDQMVMEST